KVAATRDEARRLERRPAVHGPDAGCRRRGVARSGTEVDAGRARGPRARGLRPDSFARRPLRARPVRPLPDLLHVRLDRGPAAGDAGGLLGRRGVARRGGGGPWLGGGLPLVRGLAGQRSACRASSALAAGMERAPAGGPRSAPHGPRRPPPFRHPAQSGGADSLTTTEGRASTEARRRVLFITRDFPPSRTMGAQACAQIARYLPLYGWDPIILTVRERHADSPDPSDRGVFPGAIVRTGVVPHPVSIYRTLKALRGSSGAGPGNYWGDGNGRQGGHMRRRLLSVLEAPDTYTGWIPPATIAGLRAIHRWRITHLLSSAPSWTNHLVGLTLAGLTGLPWMFHLRAPWPQLP